jgi:TRAP-type uncharacterized transport system substrate-binding protein
MSRTTLSSWSRRLAGAAALVLAAALAVPAGAEEVIASGERGRTYHDFYARNLIAQLRGIRVTNRATQGSIENLELLADGKVDVGFVQADVYAAGLRRNRGRYGGLTIIGRLADECVYLATQVAGPVGSFEALGQGVDGRKARVAVGAAEGGMAGTWKFMSVLDPSLKKATVSNTGGTLSLNQLALGMFDAVGWVTDPRNLDHVLLRAVQANPELELLPVRAPKLEHELKDGTVIYRSRTVAVAKGREAQVLPTICTSTLILAKQDARPRLVEAVSNALSFEREKLLRVQ